MADFEILDHRFQLTDAQDIVALQQGFPNWQALLEGVKEMSDSNIKTVAPIAFKRAEPQLFTTDLARSLAFYTSQLGFETRFSYGEPPFYAQVARGEAYLNLRLLREAVIDPNSSREEDYLAASICVESIKELFLDYQDKGVDFKQSLRTEPWGAKTFIFSDPDDNLILFAE